MSAVNETPEQRDARLRRFMDEVRNAYVMWLCGWRYGWPEERDMADQIYTQLVQAGPQQLARVVVLLLQEHEQEALIQRAMQWESEGVAL
jgi:hypothetical protein